MCVRGYLKGLPTAVLVCVREFTREGIPTAVSVCEITWEGLPTAACVQEFTWEGLPTAVSVRVYLGRTTNSGVCLSAPGKDYQQLFRCL